MENLPANSSFWGIAIDCKGGNMGAFPVFVGKDKHTALRTLNTAMRRLQKGTLYMGVCTALRQACYDRSVTDRIRFWVLESLENLTYLEQWLVVQQKAGVKGFEGADLILYARIRYLAHPASLSGEERVVLQKLIVEKDPQLKNYILPANPVKRIVTCLD